MRSYICQGVRILNCNNLLSLKRDIFRFFDSAICHVGLQLCVCTVRQRTTILYISSSLLTLAVLRLNIYALKLGQYNVCWCPGDRMSPGHQQPLYWYFVGMTLQCIEIKWWSVTFQKLKVSYLLLKKEREAFRITFIWRQWWLTLYVCGLINAV